MAAYTVSYKHFYATGSSKDECDQLFYINDKSTSSRICVGQAQHTTLSDYTHEKVFGHVWQE